jgi:hypothetical protein
MRTIKSIAALVGAGIPLALSILAAPRQAEAIPAFARKYETSCVTCHVGFPKLNSFGEAFRLNGYQYPVDDEDVTKDEPVSLGSESYKRVFPNAVWPNDIPGKPPVSLRVSSGFNYVRDADVETAFEAPSLILMSAGTLGENVGFYAGAHLFEEGAIGSIDRVFLQLSSLFSPHLPEKTLNIRIGQFIPNMAPFANHRGLALTPYAFNSYSALQDGFEEDHAHGGGGEAFGIEDFQLGVEASGIVQRRWRWGIGFVNGSGPLDESNSAKDGYARAAVKIGGMAFDGSGGSSESSSGENWVDNSITIGTFGFLGSYPNVGDMGPGDFERNRWGFDLSLLISDLNLFGGYMRGSDETLIGTRTRDAEYDLFFAEANYVLFPWLIGLGRFERADPDNNDALERIVVGATALYRANVKFVVETAMDPGDADFSNLQIKLDAAM